MSSWCFMWIMRIYIYIFYPLWQWLLVENMLNHQGAAPHWLKSLAWIADDVVDRWLEGYIWCMTILKQPSENPTVTLAVKSHSPPTFGSWNNHHRLTVCPAVFFLGGKGKGIPVKKSLEGWVDGWKVLGVVVGNRGMESPSFKGLESMEKLRLGVNVDDGLAAAGWVCGW